jgi:hypothetical protein
MRHSLLSPGLILGVSTGAFAEVPFTQPRSPGPYGWNLAQITMMQYASGATSPLGALIMKRLLLALVALFALFVVPAFADVSGMLERINWMAHKHRDADSIQFRRWSIGAHDAKWCAVLRHYKYIDCANGMARGQHVVRGFAQLWLILGDGVNQAADLVSGATSIPSRNLTPLMTFGN